MSTSKTHQHRYLSSQFRKFVFGVVLKELKALKEPIVIEEPRFKFRTSSITKESLRNLLKHLDLNYPRDERMRPLSYTKLNNKDMCKHIEFINKIVGQSGQTLNYIEEEWKRIMESVKC